MGRFLYKLRYFCADAWDEWRHSKAVNLMALGTLAAALFVAGLVMLVLSNVDQRVRSLSEEIRVEVFLLDEFEDSALAPLQAELESLPSVRAVQYIDKDEALRRYRLWAAEMAELATEFEENPLPASLEVFLVPGVGASQAAARIAERLSDRPGIEEVRYNEDWLGRLESTVDLARVGGTAVTALILVAVVFVMSSVLRLAVHARQDEIEIMQLVGASQGFIRGPFLVTGIAQGLAASLLALAIVEGLRRLSLSSPIAAGSPVLTDLLAAQPLSPNLSGLLLAVGILVSLAGSYFAVRQPA
jgi:cell division transport system permease protein